MSEPWVLNASPIITLAKAGHLSLLERLAVRLLVPEAVVLEIEAGPADDPARKALEAGWGTRVSAGTAPGVVLEWGLGRGETAVLTVALEQRGSIATVDDAAARACARSLGVPVLGTLGVVVRAKLHGLIPCAGDVIRALVAAGLHLDDATIRAALDQVGERWNV